MDINLLVINVGNSRLAIGTFVGGELRQSRRVELAKRDQWVPALAEAWKPIAGMDPAAVVAASVNEAMNLALVDAVGEACGRNVVWVGTQLDLPIPVKTENPEQTGVDRVLNVAAAYEQLEKACVVVDAGSAVTIDCCNDKGEFLGGAIFPGVALLLESLHNRIPHLPQVEMARPDGLIGRSTAEAIRQGVFHGIRGLVKETVEGFAESLGQWPELISTGGDAELLFGGWELIHAVAPDLTLFGIALTYAEHHIKHET
ncbi:MAG TPA: type III pantothenate kinase [Tepidisphaeraceae bacterium]|jgi:type III pantothenate kinase|nr:type III pantothenate kinase [Tepidisphaeraceae bacterium]